MGNQLATAPAQADTTQFDMSSFVPDTEDGKAVSAMPAFDLSSFTPDPQYQKSQPKTWQEQALDFIRSPFVKSTADNQAEVGNIYSISKSTGMSMTDAAKNYDQLSRNPKITGMMSEPTKGQYLGALMTEGMLAPVAAEGGIAAGALLTTKGLLGLGVFTGIDKLLGMAEDKFLPKETNQFIKDLLEIPKIVVGAVAAHGAGEFVEKGAESLIGWLLGDIAPHPVDAVPTMDLAAEHIKAITDSNLPNDAKQELLGRLEVTRQHIDASVASGKPIRVPFTNIINMAQSPHWDAIANEITENGLPKTGIETPEVKAVLAGEASPDNIPNAEGEQQGSFQKGQSPLLLDYLSQYLPPKVVASLTNDERLKLANGPWQNLRDFASQFEGEKNFGVKGPDYYKNLMLKGELNGYFSGEKEGGKGKVKNTSNVSLAEVEKQVRSLDTENLESLMDTRYEAGASQKELDFLENIYAERVSEEELNMSEDNEQSEKELEGNGRYGVDLESQLEDFYSQFKLSVNERDGQYTDKELIDNMRSNLAHGYGSVEEAKSKLENVSDEDIVNAAKDVAEWKQKLNERRAAKGEPVVESNVEEKPISPMTGGLVDEDNPKFQTNELVPQGDINSIKIGKELTEEEKGKAEISGRELVRKYFPQLADSLVNVEYLMTEAGKKGLGLYYDLKTRIAKDAPLITYLHEMGHSIFDMFLTPSEKRTLLDGAAERNNVNIEREEGESDKDYQGRIDHISEEHLMREFTEYAGQGKDAQLKDGKAISGTFSDRIKGLFQRLSYRIQKFFGANLDKSKEFFESILRGEFANEKSIQDTAGQHIPKFMEEKDLEKQKYFPLKPLGIKEVVGKRGDVDLNKTGRDIVKRYIGRYQEQVVRVQDLADDIRGIEKDKSQQDAMSIYASFGGDEAKIAEWIDKADKEVDEYNKEYWEKEVKPAAELALSLSDEAKQGIALGNQYFKESGLAMKSVGAIRSFLENYGINRMYQDEPAERVLKGNDYDNPQQSTGHSKKRFYENMIDAVIGGKRFKTMNYPDLIGIHGEEAASVTVGRQYAQESAPKDMGDWVNKDSVPAGWKQVGNMSRDIPMKYKDTKEAIMDEQGNQKILKQVFVAPAAIADDMSVITDPDNLKKVGFMQKAGALNNAVKSINVMVGLFHDKQFILQKLSSPGGIKGLKDTFTGQLSNLMQQEDFKEGRLRMLRTGVGMSNKVQSNIDVIKLANATGKDASWLNKITSLPVIKQAAQLVDWHTHNLFQVMGEYYKVDNFMRNTAKWDLAHPDATDEERLQADRGYAQASNNAFGGHNWAGLGYSKEAITAARTAWFAPDWLYSAIRSAGSGVSDWKGIAGSQGTEGNATRAIVIKGLLYGTAATQLANYMINGHFTNENSKGHKMEIELSPKNHISMYPAATGEIVKMLSDIGESGLTGISRYLQGKLSPVARLVVTWASHTSYAGQDITKETGGVGAQIAKTVPEEYKEAVTKQVNYVSELLSTVAPLPFVVQPGPAGYVGEQVKNATEGKPSDIAGSATLVTGLSRFSQGQSESNKAKDIDQEVEKGLEKGDQTSANKYLQSGDISQERVNALQAKADQTPVEKAYKHLSVEKIIKKADGNMNDMSAEDQDELKTMLQDKYQRMESAGKASPNEIKRVGELLATFYDKHKIQ